MTNIFRIVAVFAKAHKILSGLGFIIIATAMYFVVSGNGDVAVKTTSVQRGSVVQEVSVTGRVKSAESVDLTFEKSGRIAAINVDVGDKVRRGQLLVRLDMSELSAQRVSAVAGVQSAQNKLNQLLAGARPEDVAVLRIALESAQKTLLQSETSDTLSAVRSAFNQAITAMVLFTEMQTKYATTFMRSSTIADEVAAAKAQALEKLVGGTGYDLGRTSSEYFLSLNGGQKMQIAAAETQTFDARDFLSDARGALLATRNALEVMQGKLAGVSGVSSTDTSTIGTTVGSVNTQLTALADQEQTITTNENLVKDAQSKLTLKEAPAQTFDVDIARSVLEQAKATLATTEAQMSKMSMFAPMEGIITDIQGERGEMASVTAPTVSMIGVEKLQIEANVAEADIAKVKIGNQAEVTLDAYGSDTVFLAQVIHIDPAGKIIEGVAVYRVTFQFLEDDARVLAGLTANIDIQTAKLDGVLYAPSRDIITRDTAKYVQVFLLNDNKNARLAQAPVISGNKNGRIVEVPIRTGLRGSDGRTEVIDGLEEGDLVVGE